MKPLYRLTPHARLSHNPLFALETRRVRWGHSAKTLVDYSILLVSAVCVIVVLVWLLSRLNTRYLSPYTDTMRLIVAFSLILSLLLDYRCMTTAVGSINGEIAARRWDLLRLTALENPQIVAAKYGATQVRVWRLMVLIIGSRLAAALTFGLSMFLDVLTGYGWNTQPRGAVISTLIGQAVLVFFAALFIIEPFWRMRAVTALGMAISARARERATSVLAAVGVLAAFWLVQGIIITAMVFAVSVILLPLGVVEYSVNRLIICAPLLFVVVLLATVYGFYSAVQAWSLRYAERWTARH
jgi:hypothetical protein